MLTLKEIPTNEIRNLITNFNDIKYPFVESVILGNNGILLATSSKKTLIFHQGVYAFITGEFSEQAISCMLKKVSPRCFIMSDNDNCFDFIINKYPKNAQLRERVSMSYQGADFDYYQAIVDTLQHRYSMAKMDYKLIKNISTDWCRRLLIGFNGIDDFHKRGVGYCVFDNNKIVSGVTSLSLLSNGIEFQLMTHKGYEGQGLAQIVSSKLLQHCLKKNLIPYWEAANEPSRHIAEKLGFAEAFRYKSVFVNFEA
jgi:hypothetical protein